ncbi:MAG TPA: glycosyltransferase [Conexibacter sp.]|jgi:GT2 family glycosyltransferase|nr:glycosyltransferase [Conexibacter sp.]
MSRPLVSVVVPTYNRAGFVETALDSLLDQDYDALEVIALDDGSTDETPAVLARIAERTDPGRFNWSRHDNVGQAATINRGLARAKGELLGYLSSDDYLLPGAIGRLVAAAEADPDADVIYPWFHVVDDADRVIDTIECLEHNLRDALRWVLCMPGVGALMRRRCFERIGDWDERYRFCPDFEWWIRARDARFHRVPEALGAWRAHDGSISTGGLDIGYVHELLRVLDDLYAADDVPAELLEVKDEAYSSAHTLGAIVLRRGAVHRETDPRFAIEDRLAARYSRLAALHERDEIANLRHAFRAADRERRTLRELILEQQRTVDTLEQTARDREVRIAELEVVAGMRPGRPALMRMGRALTPPALRPHLGAAVHRLRSRP